MKPSLNAIPGLSPRWQKVLNDLWYNKGRILLAIISIAVGVFAVGTVGSGVTNFQRAAAEQYTEAQPASGALLLPAFDDDLLDYARKLPTVAEADATRNFVLRMFIPAEVSGAASDEWRNIEIIAVEDFSDMRLNLVFPDSGLFPPPNNTILIERSALSLTYRNVGDSLIIETTNGILRTVPISGVVYGPTQMPSRISGDLTGYVTFDTLAWLEQPRQYNTLHLRTAEDEFNRARVESQLAAARERVEAEGWAVIRLTIPQYPGRPPLEAVIQSVVLLLNVIGIMLTGISGLLVTNVMEALLTQQIKQIGIMRIIGAQLHQVIVLYYVFVLVLAVLALIIAIPPSVLAGRALANFAAGLLNSDIRSYTFPPLFLALQIGLALIVALTAATRPILNTTLRITVREAITPFTTSSAVGASRLDQLLERIRGVQRPVVLSLRNMFRQKLRLILTLITLVLAGAVFIAVFSVNDSLLNNINTTIREFLRFDVQVSFSRPYRLEEVLPIVQDLPGVTHAEGWTGNRATLIRPDGSEGDPIVLVAAPGSTDLLAPRPIEGRWLLPTDENAVVINNYVLEREPDLQVGDTLTLRINERDTEWQIVGVFRSSDIGSDPGLLHVNYEYYARVTRTIGQITSLRILTTANDLDGQQALLTDIVAELEANGFRVSSATTATENQLRIAELIGILTSVLLVMALMLAFVGAISLTGTMGINVIERTREIGVMRALGASSNDLLLITLIEALFIGSLSWGLGALLGIPFSMALSHALGLAFFRIPLLFQYSYVGMFLWLGLSLFLSALASIMPARNAMTITVRDAISYE